jgi:lipopolysaccharide export system ATP-binding protein
VQIQTENLVKRYRGRTVVDGISLSVSQGEIVGLLGHNGAGKTTTFYMVVGLVRPDGGRVLLEGQEITRLPVYRRARAGIGYLPQEASVFRKLSVSDNLRLVLETTSLSAAEQKERAERLMVDFNIAHLRDQKGYLLSGGERRRVEIARALATRPAFILLDEPFTGIDPIEVHTIQQLVAELKARGIGVLITDHNVRETLATTDRAYIVKDGKIMTSGSSAEIAEDPLARQYYLGEHFRM